MDFTAPEPQELVCSVFYRSLERSNFESLAELQGDSEPALALCEWVEESQSSSHHLRDPCGSSGAEVALGWAGLGVQ